MKLDLSSMETKGLLENSNLHFNVKIDIETSEIKHPYTANDLSYQFKIYPKVKLLTGSVHKSINKSCQLGSHNANDLTYMKLYNEIDRMNNVYNIDPLRTKFQNIEFGVNFKVDHSPSTIIRNNIIGWDRYPISRNLEFNGKGKFYEWSRKQYKIKLYDKSNQYQLNDNIMRIEKKIIKAESINRFGIKVLNDLKDKSKLSLLANELIKTYDKLIFVDELDTTQLNESNKTIWSKMTNPKYWEWYSSESKTAKERQQHKRDKEKFNSIIDCFDLEKQKKKYRKRILTKLNKFRNVTT